MAVKDDNHTVSQASNMGKLDCRSDATSMILGNHLTIKITIMTIFMTIILGDHLIISLQPCPPQVTWCWSSARASSLAPLAPW